MPCALRRAERRLAQPIGLRPRAAGPLGNPAGDGCDGRVRRCSPPEVGAEGADQRLRLRGRLPIQQAGQRLRRLARLAARDRGGAYPRHGPGTPARTVSASISPTRGSPGDARPRAGNGRSEFEAAGAVHARRGSSWARIGIVPEDKWRLAAGQHPAYPSGQAGASSFHPEQETRNASAEALRP